MNKEKNPVQLLKELDSLLTAKKNLINTEEINGIIAETAEEFMASINADLDDELQEDSTPSATPKSEMPCNCHKEKILQGKIIDAVINSVKNNLPPDTKVAAFIAN